MHTPSIERKVVEGLPLPPLKVKSESEVASLTLHYRFDESGWAIFTVSAVTCTLDIQSDWGNYSYRWPGGGCGDTPFLEWLARTCQRDPRYITEKLSYDCKSLAHEYDEDLTRRNVKKLLLEERRSWDIDKDTALERWHAVIDSFSDWDMGTDDMFHHTAPDWAYEMFGGESPAATVRPGYWVILQHALIPFFGEKLAEHLDKDAA